jgi:hypothetical protein
LCPDSWSRTCEGSALAEIGREQAGGTSLMVEGGELEQAQAKARTAVEIVRKRTIPPRAGPASLMPRLAAFIAE